MDILIATPIEDLEGTSPLTPPKMFKLKHCDGKSNTYSFAQGRIYDTLGLNKAGEIIIACDVGSPCVLTKSFGLEYRFDDPHTGYQASFLAYDNKAPDYEEVIIVFADGLGGQVILAASHTAKAFFKHLAPELRIFTSPPPKADDSSEDDAPAQEETALEQGLHYVTLKWMQEEDIDGSTTRSFEVVRTHTRVSNITLRAALEYELGLL